MLTLKSSYSASRREKCDARTYSASARARLIVTAATRTPLRSAPLELGNLVDVLQFSVCTRVHGGCSSESLYFLKRSRTQLLKKTVRNHEQCRT